MSLERRIVEALGDLKARIEDPKIRGSVGVAGVLHDAIGEIRGISFMYDGEAWNVVAPVGTDRKAFDEMVERARAAVGT